MRRATLAIATAISLGLPGASASAARWEVHPNPCPVPAAAEPYRPEEGVAPPEAEGATAFWPPAEIIIPVSGWRGRPLYLRLEGDIFETVPDQGCSAASP